MDFGSGDLGPSLPGWVILCPGSPICNMEASRKPSSCQKIQTGSCSRKARVLPLLA